MVKFVELILYQLHLKNMQIAALHTSNNWY